MSKNRRHRPVRSSMSKNRERSAGSAHQRLASSVAMWFGTMSSISPSPARRAAASASNSRSPPSSSEKRVGSTTS